jgi:hypothetical protein
VLPSLNKGDHPKARKKLNLKSFWVSLAMVCLKIKNNIQCNPALQEAPNINLSIHKGV